MGPLTYGWPATRPPLGIVDLRWRLGITGSHLGVAVGPGGVLLVDPDRDRGLAVSCLSPCLIPERRLGLGTVGAIYVVVGFVGVVGVEHAADGPSLGRAR